MSRILFRNIVGMLSIMILNMTTAEAQISGADVEFKKVHLWDEFYTEGATVADVNRDGKPDIIAGARWFEAPDWKAHQFRALKGKVDEKGRTYSVNEKGIGYWDDFMNVPLDVDGDGLLDVVTCCWFSKQIDWYRNTGTTGGEWPMTIGEKNGNYE